MYKGENIFILMDIYVCIYKLTFIFVYWPVNLTDLAINHMVIFYW